MNVNDVIALAKAGYTRDEISQFFAPAPAAPASAPAPAPAPASAPEVTLDSLSGQIAELSKAVQMANINGLSQGTPAPQTANDILSGIISGQAK